MTWRGEDPTGVSVAILTPEEAHELRIQAQAVLRTLRQRKRCQCKHPWHDVGGYCGCCGRWIENTRFVRALRRYIDGMEQVEVPMGRADAPLYREDLVNDILEAA